MHIASKYTCPVLGLHADNFIVQHHPTFELRSQNPSHSNFTALELEKLAKAKKICSDAGLHNIPVNFAIAIADGHIKTGDNDESFFARLLSDQSWNINQNEYARRWSRQVKMLYLECYLSRSSKSAHRRFALNMPLPSADALWVNL